MIFKENQKTTTTNLSQKSKEEIQKMNVFQTNQIVKISLWRMNTKKKHKKTKGQRLNLVRICDVISKYIFIVLY